MRIHLTFTLVQHAQCVSCRHSSGCKLADFMERMEFKYDAKARESGCCVVSGAGFDSIPADVGCLWTQRKFGPAGVPATVESYLTLHCKRRLQGAAVLLH